MKRTIIFENNVSKSYFKKLTLFGVPGYTMLNLLMFMIMALVDITITFLNILIGSNYYIGTFSAFLTIFAFILFVKFIFYLILLFFSFIFRPIISYKQCKEMVMYMITKKVIIDDYFYDI